ncbi:MAG TPA: porin, partial [Burkholderiales bacterium]|nr:porin [Burkholderiales bacterium]
MKRELEDVKSQVRDTKEGPTPPAKSETMPSNADETQKAVEMRKEADRQSAAIDKQAAKEGEEKGFLRALSEGFVPSDTEYEKAPYTPMLLRLHRPERFGVHLHNVEVRYSDQPGLTTSTGTTHTQFQAATAELEASGYIFPGLVYAQVVIEPRDNLGRGLGDSIAKNISASNAPTGILRDAFFDLVLAEPGATVRLGQQRIPFGIEAQTPGGLLPFTSRSYLDLKLTRNAGLDNTKFSNAEFIQERDIGAQTRGRLAGGKFEYAVGVFNGAGINVSDTNNSKDVVGRLGFNPLRGLRFGVSGYEGTQVDIQSKSGNRDRIGA